MFNKLSKVTIAILFSTVVVNARSLSVHAADLNGVSSEATTAPLTTFQNQAIAETFSRGLLLAAVNTPAGAPTSESAETNLARYLTQMGAKVYGADNCPFTRLQRQLFGNAAFQQLNYIECNPQSKQAQLGLCRAVQLKQTPTWEIDGRIYQGVRSLEQLARLSHYQGPVNFQNALQTP